MKSLWPACSSSYKARRTPSCPPSFCASHASAAPAAFLLSRWYYPSAAPRPRRSVRAAPRRQVGPPLVRARRHQRQVHALAEHVLGQLAGAFVRQPCHVSPSAAPARLSPSCSAGLLPALAAAAAAAAAAAIGVVQVPQHVGVGAFQMRTVGGCTPPGGSSILRKAARARACRASSGTSRRRSHP
jgi:hypothetical protein